jgi:ankyrin repeat protein
MATPEHAIRRWRVCRSVASAAASALLLVVCWCAIVRVYRGGLLVDAAKNGDFGTVQELTSAGTMLGRRDGMGRTALHWAADLGSAESVRALLDAGADVDPLDREGYTPLLAAAQNGRVEAARCLLQHGADLHTNASGWGTPLAAAVDADQGAMVRLLVSCGADPNARLARRTGENDYVLEWASGFGCTEAVAALLECGADPHLSSGGGTALVPGARYPEIVEMLLAHGANPNSRDDNGITPLMAAAMSADSIRLLVDSGADANAADENGTTALHRAVGSWAGSDECVALLLEAGTDPNAVDAHGTTPLHRAAWCGTPAAVADILRHGGDVDARTDYGWTPLHRAAMGNRDPTLDGQDPEVEIARLLLAGGADLGIKDSAGRTALDQARYRGKQELVALLEGASKTRGPE